MLLITSLVIAAILCVALSYFQLQFRHMGEQRVQATAEKAESLIDADPYRAERVINQSLRLNGWDYHGYLFHQKANKAFMIGQAVPKIVILTRMLRLTPEKNFPWMLPLFLLLGDIYLTQGKNTKAGRLFEDTLSFIGGYGQDIPYAEKSIQMSRIHSYQAALEQRKRNHRSAIKYHLTAYIEELASLKGAGNEKSFDEKFPYREDSFLTDSLTALDRSDDVKKIVEIVNKTVRNSQGRINVEILSRDLDGFFVGVTRNEETDFEVGKDIIQKALIRFGKEDSE